jgi:hypothetical protein
VIFTGFYADKYPRSDTVTPAAYSPSTPDFNINIPKPKTNHFQSILDAPRLKFPNLLRTAITKTLNNIQNPDRFQHTHSPSISSKKSQFASLIHTINSYLTNPTLQTRLQKNPKNHNFLTQEHIPYLKTKFTAISSIWDIFSQKFAISWAKISNLKETIISKIDIENFGIEKNFDGESEEILELRKRVLGLEGNEGCVLEEVS